MAKDSAPQGNLPENGGNGNSNSGKGNGKKNIKIAILQRNIVNVLLRQGYCSKLPPCAVDFRVYEPANGKEKGELQVVEVVGSVATKVSPKHVARYLAGYLTKVKDPNYIFTAKQIEDTVKLWLQSAPLIDEPVPFLFKSDEGLCFRRADFDPDHTFSCPDWDEFFDDVRFKERAMAFLWTFFIPDSYRQQYLYIKGEGGDGKGTIIKVLGRLTNDVYCITKPPSDDNKHFGVEFERARFVVLTDLRQVGFLRSEIWLAYTGDDFMQVDPKGKNPYNARPRGKGIVLSNFYPVIGAQESEQRRILYCEKMTPQRAGRDARYEDRLYDQLPGFLGKCRQEFEKLGISPSQEIPKTPEMIDKCRTFALDSSDGGYQSFFAYYFVAYPLSANEEENRQYKVRSTEVEYLLRLKYPEKKHREGFKTWLFSVHQISAQQVWPSGDRYYFRLGRKNVQ